jgi:hypothetical protein
LKCKKIDAATRKKKIKMKKVSIISILKKKKKKKKIKITKVTILSFIKKKKKKKKKDLGR